MPQSADLYAHIEPVCSMQFPYPKFNLHVSRSFVTNEMLYAYRHIKINQTKRPRSWFRSTLICFHILSENSYMHAGSLDLPIQDQRFNVLLNMLFSFVYFVLFKVHEKTFLVVNYKFSGWV